MFHQTVAHPASRNPENEPDSPAPEFAFPCYTPDMDRVDTVGTVARRGGSGKILFIAPYREILATGLRIVEELGLSQRIEVCLGLHAEGLRVAREAEAEGAELIIARGGTAELIARSGIKIPIIEIPLTIRDLAEILIAARSISGTTTPRVALIAFRNMMQHLEILSRMMSLRSEVYELESEAGIGPAVEAAWHSGVDVVIGGITTTTLAASRGLKTVILSSGEDSCREAILQALRMSAAMAQEKERLEKFRIIVEYSAQGILGTGSDGRISVSNQAAGRLLARPASDLIGQHIGELLPDIPVSSAMAGHRAMLGQLVTLASHRLMVNIVPIEVGASLAGSIITIEDVGQIQKMEAKVRSALYSRGLYAEYRFSDIFGHSPAIEEARRIATEYAATDSTILIYGESGTGKELFAQSIHTAGRRASGPFVAVNCGAIPSSLLESELFGYEEGAFTGANRRGKPGLFELAHGGTIFLDEIGELDKLAQTSLLRVIQERRVMRLGSDKFLPVDVRIITATNRDLARLIREGRFREDLYYRINVLPLALPPLRDRPGDLPGIAEHFLAEYNELYGKKARLTAAARAFIEAYSWPGNLRQLRNYVERFVVTGRDDLVEAPLREDDAEPLLPDQTPYFGTTPQPFRTARATAPGLSSATPRPPAHPDSPEAQSAKAQAGQIRSGTAKGSCLEESSRLALTEKERILEALALAHYNQQEAAHLLGINRSTLFRKMRALEIEVRRSCGE